MEKGTSYGMPSFKVAGKFFARLRDDDTVLVIHLRSFEERDRLLENEPAAFFSTDHYRNYPTVLVRLARVSERLLNEVLADAWRRGAPRRLLEPLQKLSPGGAPSARKRQMRGPPNARSADARER
jgi:hypothetical protein